MSSLLVCPPAAHHAPLNVKAVPATHISAVNLTLPTAIVPTAIVPTAIRADSSPPYRRLATHTLGTYSSVPPST
eukprot:1874531-Prymnesium_polylepis.2